MALSERGLGRGLGALLQQAEEATQTSEKLALTQIIPCSFQPRKYFSEASLMELAASIKEQGLLQPILVRKKEASHPQVYEIIAGERRWRAAKLAGLTELPVIIKEYSDAEVLTVALIENLQREDLNPIEEAEAYQTLREQYNLSQEELAQKLSKSRPAVANSLRLLQLPVHVQAKVRSKALSAGHARALIPLAEKPAELADLIGQIEEQQLSVRDVEHAVEIWKKQGSIPDAAAMTTQANQPDQDQPDGQIAPESPIPSPAKSKADRAYTLNAQTTLYGTAKKGRLEIRYASEQELTHLLEMLGIENAQIPRSRKRSGV